jgi:hypothetical protein
MVCQIKENHKTIGVKMKDIEILTFKKITDRSYEATGRIGQKEFLSKTIVHQGKPIFKVFEDGIVKKKDQSNFSVGEKMSIARILKKYSQGKVDKLGRPADNPKDTGIGIVIQLQNKIDDLLLENETLKSLLIGNGIQHPLLETEETAETEETEETEETDDVQ